MASKRRNQIASMMLFAVVLALLSFFFLGDMNDTAFVIASVLLGLSLLVAMEAGYAVVRKRAHESMPIVVLGNAAIVIFIVLVAIGAYRMNRGW